MLKNYKHVIWDWNGTLFNDVFLCHSILNRLLCRNKVSEVTFKRYREIFNFPVKDYYVKAGFDFTKTPFEILGKEFMDEYEVRKTEAAIFDEAIEVLKTIDDAGLTQSVLSAYPHDTLVEIVDFFGINKYFTDLTGLDNIYAASKVEQGKKWMQKSGFTKGEVVFVGDTIHDYEVAMEIDADSILIADGHQSEERLSGCGVPVFKDLVSFKNELISKLTQ